MERNMSNDCGGKCDEHGDLIRGIGYLKGVTTVILSLMLVLTAGMGYALIQNHRLDMNIVLLTDTVQDNNVAFISSRDRHDNGVAELRSRVANLSIACCDDKPLPERRVMTLGY